MQKDAGSDPTCCIIYEILPPYSKCIPDLNWERVKGEDWGLSGLTKIRCSCGLKTTSSLC